MKHSGFTKQERHFITLMRVWFVVFLGLAILFAFMPGIILNYINDIGKVFFDWRSPALERGGDLWRVHSVALHLCLAYICALAQASSLRNAGYVRIVLLATALSAAGSAAMIYIDAPQFYYLAAASIDGVIFLITLWIYSSSARSRS